MRVALLRIDIYRKTYPSEINFIKFLDILDPTFKVLDFKYVGILIEFNCNRLLSE